MKKVLLLSAFYLLSFIPGFTPFIYESDYNSFVANQAFWMFIMVVLYYLVEEKELKIIAFSLILLTGFELIDELIGINSYLPDNIPATNKKLLLDLIIIGTITLFTINRLIKQWRKKKTYS